MLLGALPGGAGDLPCRFTCAVALTRCVQRGGFARAQRRAPRLPKHAPAKVWAPDQGLQAAFTRHDTSVVPAPWQRRAGVQSQHMRLTCATGAGPGTYRCTRSHHERQQGGGENLHSRSAVLGAGLPPHCAGGQQACRRGDKLHGAMLVPAPPLIAAPVLPSCQVGLALLHLPSPWIARAALDRAQLCSSILQE